MALCAVTMIPFLIGVQQSQSTSAAAEKVVVWAVSDNITSFDPAFTGPSQSGQALLANIFDRVDTYALSQRTTSDGYKYFVHDTTKVICEMCENREVSADGKTITWHLKPGLKYHNGDPLTAQDLVETYRRLFAAKSGAVSILSMTTLESADQFKALDERTLQVTLKQPNALFLNNSIMGDSDLAVISPKEVESHKTSDDPWARNYFKTHAPTGNGPFVLKEYVPNDRIVLEAWNDFRAGRAKVDRVVMKIIPDPVQRIQMLKRGEVDLVQYPPVNQVGDLRKTSGVEVISVQLPGVTWLDMSHAQAPWKGNKALREAVAYAVPYDTLVKNVYKGFAVRAKSLIGVGMPGSDQEVFNYSTNLGKAQAKLAEAGYPGGKGLPALKLSYRSGVEEDEKMAVFIQANLEKIGMKVNLEALPGAEFVQQQQTRRLNFWINNWYSWINDPFYHTYYLVRSQAYTDFDSYQNPKVDELVQSWIVSPDASGRLRAAKLIQKYLAEDVAHVYLVQPFSLVGLRKNLSGYVHAYDELPRFYALDKP